MTSLTLDLSKIFNETGYINESDHCEYNHNHNNSVAHIILIQSNNSAIKIGNDFLRSYCNLISIDTSKIVNVIAIENYFLYDCRKLTIFDTTGLTSLTTIGNSFLSCCINLTIFDATKLSSLITIGNSFLLGCANLTIFDATKLSSLTNIGNDFFRYCDKNLTVIVNNSPNCLHNKLLKTNCIITRLYNKPVVHLVNDCVI